MKKKRYNFKYFKIFTTIFDQRFDIIEEYN